MSESIKQLRYIFMKGGVKMKKHIEKIIDSIKKVVKHPVTKEIAIKVIPTIVAIIIRKKIR